MPGFSFIKYFTTNHYYGTGTIVGIAKYIVHFGKGAGGPAINRMPDFDRCAKES
ncbi:MAG TPA: hypothetical protein VHO90_21170 [Bacteroidales bacterium]|nr:hypothetical protein [Bacteroidales bacterium]